MLISTILHENENIKIEYACEGLHVIPPFFLLHEESGSGFRINPCALVKGDILLFARSSDTAPAASACTK